MWRSASGSRAVPVVGVLAAVVLVVWLPAGLAPGVPAGHDAGAHLTYVHLFDHAVREGQFPVRWVEWVTPGRGQPLFNIYQPGFFYLVSAVHLVVPSLTAAMMTTVTLLWWGGAMAMAVTFRRLGLLPATTAAVLFASAPYLVLDVYVRMALPELAAIAVAPMVLASLEQLSRASSSRGGVVMLALFTALLLLLHLPSVLLLLPLFAAFTVWRAATSDDGRRYLGNVAIGVALGGGLAAFYVLPAIAERDAVHMHELTSEYFDFRGHFLEPRDWVERRWGFGGSKAGRPHEMAPQVGVGQWLAIVSASVLMVVAASRRRLTARTVEMALWLGVVAMALFLTIRASLPVWEAIGPLAYVQFPWRALMVVSIGAGALGALAMAALPKRRWQVVVLLVGVTGMTWLLHDRLAPQRYLEPRAFDIDNPWWRHGAGAASLAFREEAYRPLSAAGDPGVVHGRWRVEGTAHVKPLDVRDHRMTLTVDAAEDARLVVHTPYAPGWEIRVDGQVTAVAIDSETGFMRVALPAGTHEIDVRMRATPMRAAANGVSLASVGIVAWIGVVPRRGAMRARRRAPSSTGGS